MGDGDKAPLRLQFNPSVRLEFHGSTITSDAGLLPLRGLDEALGLTHIAADYLQESRTGRNIQHHLVPLLRQSIYSRLAGYDDTNDAERLAQAPAMRVVVGWQGSDRSAASANTMSRFETEILTRENNLKELARMNAQWVDGTMAHTSHRRVILDLDSSESPVHGQQEGAAYNGHFECVCYHPLFCFNQFGDCEGAVLRPGNVHSADGWQEFIEPIVERYLKAAVRLLFRADAAFAKPEIYEYLERRSIGYAIRLRANEVLQREIAHLLVRPTEWPSRKPIVSYHDFAYQAQSWNVSRRVVAKVEWHQGELFPRVGFIVTNLSYPTIGIVRFYNGRGTAEQWIKEGKQALNWTRLSCHRFVANQVRLWLFVLAYNLGNFMRRLALPEAMKHWSLTSLQTRLIKTGGRLVRHARRLVFQLPEVMVSGEMLAGMLERISRLRLAPG
jgi:Transposase DDE domain group 1